MSTISHTPSPILSRSSSSSDLSAYPKKKSVELTRMETVAKQITKFIVRGLLFAGALSIGVIAAVIGGINPFIGAVVGGFAFAGAMGLHNKIMSIIDAHFENRAQKRLAQQTQV